MPRGQKNQNMKQKQYCNKFNKTLHMVHIKNNVEKNKWSSLRIYFLLAHPTERVPPPIYAPERLKCFYSYIRQKLHRGSQGQPWKMFINKATTSGLSCPSLPSGFTSPCQLSLVDCGESHTTTNCKGNCKPLSGRIWSRGSAQNHPEPLRNGDLWTTQEEKLSTMRKKVISKRGHPGTERALQKTAEPCVLNETFMLKVKHLC